MLRFRDIEFLIEDGVSSRILIHAGRPVANPLASNENRQLYVKLNLSHFEWRSVPMAHQIHYEATVFVHLLCATAVRNTGGLYDRVVVAHVVDDAYEAVIQHLEGFIEDFLQR